MNTVKGAAELGVGSALQEQMTIDVSAAGEVQAAKIEAPKIHVPVTDLKALAEVQDDDDCPKDPIEWANLFQEFVDNPPNDGDMLLTADGSPARLTIDLSSGNDPFIYGRAYVPTKVGSKLGWFAQSINEATNYGWKVILLPKSRDQVIKRLGIRTKFVQVKSLLIIRRSLSGQSLLGEVCEW